MVVAGTVVEVVTGTVVVTGAVVEVVTGTVVVARAVVVVLGITVVVEGRIVEVVVDFSTIIFTKIAELGICHLLTIVRSAW